MQRLDSPQTQLPAVAPAQPREDTATRGARPPLSFDIPEGRKSGPEFTYVAIIIGVFWVGGAGAYIWGYYDGLTIVQLPLPTLIITTTGILLPLLLIWLLAFSVQRGRELRETSDELARVSRALLSPDKVAGREVARLGQTIRRELDGMSTGIQSTADRLSVLSGTLNEQLSAIRQAGEQTEGQAQNIGKRLDQERKGLEETGRNLAHFTQEVSEVMKSQAALVRDVTVHAKEEIRTAQTQLESRSQNLRNSASALTDSVREAGREVERQATRLDTVAESALERAERMGERYDQQRTALSQTASRLGEESARLEVAVEDERKTVERLVQMLAFETSRVEGAINDVSSGVDKALESAQGKAVEFTGFAEREAEKMAAAFRAVEQYVAQSANAIKFHANSAQEAVKVTQAGLDENAEALNERFLTAKGDIAAARDTFADVMAQIGSGADDAARKLTDASEALEARIAQLPQEAEEGAKVLREAISERIDALSRAAHVVARQLPPNSASATQSATEDGGKPSSRIWGRKSKHASPKDADLKNLSPRDSGAKKADTSGSDSDWSLGDALRAAEARHQRDAAAKNNAPERNEQTGNFSGRITAGSNADAERAQQHRVERLQATAIDLTRGLEHEPPEDLWQRYLAGERDVFARRLASSTDPDLRARIARKYGQDSEFRTYVDRYLKEFESLIEEAAGGDPEAVSAESYLSSETGRLYLVLAQASGRLS